MRLANAPMENLWGMLKSELTHHPRDNTRHEAIKKITEPVDVIYNTQRRQKRLGDLISLLLHMKGCTMPGRRRHEQMFDVRC